MKICLLFILLVGSFLVAQGQKYILDYKAEAGGAVPADGLPFWLRTNTNGKITGDTYLWGNIRLNRNFTQKNTRAFDYAFGAEGTGALGKEDNRIFVNQLYGRIRWQNIVLDLGMLDRDIRYDGLSSTNGDMLFSGNSRSLPGICLSTWDYIRLPWIGKWVAFRAKYAEYTMIDNRYMGNRTRLHNKLLAGRLTPIPQLSISGGVEDYGQWGGRDPINGKTPHSFKDYVRMVMIKRGGADASESDQINKMGNHLGIYFARINFTTSLFETEIFYNHPFEDGSGMKYQNHPDGLYGIYFSRKNSKKWFQSFLYEFQYTKSQSGPFHSRAATPEEIAGKKPDDPYPNEIVLGGNDDYFNHGEYLSGWTFYGQTIGSPFFMPASLQNGISQGIRSSRFVAHHIGLCGTLPVMDIGYTIKCSYSRNYGRHSDPFLDENGMKIAKPQFSFGSEFIMPEKKLPFSMALQIGFDKGELLENNFGVMLRIFKIGLL